MVVRRMTGDARNCKRVHLQSNGIMPVEPKRNDLRASDSSRTAAWWFFGSLLTRSCFVGAASAAGEEELQWRDC